MSSACHWELVTINAWINGWNSVERPGSHESVSLVLPWKYRLQSEMPMELPVQENPSGQYLDPMLMSIVHTTGVIVHAKNPVWSLTSPYCSSTLLFSLSLE